VTNNLHQSRTKLLVLTSTFPRYQGDTEPAFVLELCRQLADEFEITVLAPHAHGAQDRETIDGIRIVRFRYAPEGWETLAYNGGIMANLRRNPWLYCMLPAFFFAQLIGLIILIRRIAPDTIHAHWLIPQGIVLATVKTFGRIKPHTVCTAHGSDVITLRGRIWRYLRKWITSRCANTVAVSASLKNTLVSDGCKAGKIQVIPMGADLRHLFTPDQTPRKQAELLFVGRLVPGKGTDILVRAIPSILEKCQNLTVTIVGDGPELENLRTLSQQLNIMNRVSFTGSVSHETLPAYYRRATMLVAPSLAEGFGLVPVEALGCGCPVAASDLPSFRGILDSGRAGRFFRPGDPEDLARTVTAMLMDGNERSTAANSGRLHVLSNYDWRVISQLYTSILRPLILKHGSGENRA
jgi:glycosyltransferase involved in cell wall biosynthesis